MDCRLPGSSIHGILQARILEWVSFPPSGDLPDLRLLHWNLNSLPLSHQGNSSLITDMLNCLFSRQRLPKYYLMYSTKLEKMKGVQSVSGLGLMIGIKAEKPTPEIISAGIERGVLFLSAHPWD